MTFDDSYDRAEEMKYIQSLNAPATVAEMKEHIARLETENERQDSIIAGMDRELSELIFKRDSYNELVADGRYVCESCANALYTAINPAEAKKGVSTFTACLLSNKADASLLCNQFIPIKNSI